MSGSKKAIAFQGAHGAYSDLSCRTVFPGLPTLPCNSFEDAFEVVRGGEADLAMIPVDNTIAGRVADVHHLMPGGDLFIIGEHFQPVHHALLGVKGSKLESLTTVHSHIHALPQCKKFIKAQGLKGVVHADTAGAAREIAEKNDPAHAAIASTLAAEIYGLEILKTDIQDRANNVTRFVILSREPETPDEKSPTITSLIFEARNIPAALYKCLGGFATAGFNLTRLESYVNENFEAARFYVDIEGHP
ncbi:MAG TPA: prephenate dehydratase, partial [Alphaproteobacteria bacterium]|nr:prephenate dehydratase [Alphaproteobacteria bacterium]